MSPAVNAGNYPLGKDALYASQNYLYQLSARPYDCINGDWQYALAGMSDGNACSYGNQFGAGVSPSSLSSNSPAACSGRSNSDGKYYCGGPNAMETYRNTRNMDGSFNLVYPSPWTPGAESFIKGSSSAVPDIQRDIRKE